MLKKQVLKKSVAWLLLVCMLCSFAPVSAFAANETSTVTITNSSSGSTDGASSTTGTSGSGNGGMPILPVVTYVEVATLAELESALSTGKSVRLTADIVGDVTVQQQAGVDVVIDGNGKTFTGELSVIGGSSAETATLSIANVVFQTAEGKDACISTPDRTTSGVYAQTHNVLVTGCTFKGNTVTPKTAAAIRHRDGGDKNWTIVDCTVDENMHSLLQVNNVTGKLVIDNCTVNSKNGMNLNSCTNVEITNSVFDVEGYVVRSGAKTGGNPDELKTLVLENNTLKNNNSGEDAVIAFRAGSVALDVSMTKNVVSGTAHFSGLTDAAVVSADANYWTTDGTTAVSAPVVAAGSTEVKVDTYYSDDTLTDLVTSVPAVDSLAGEGTVDNPYLINTIEELEWFRDDVNAGNTYDGEYVKLTADINLADEAWTPIGNATNKFLGTFDGDNHTVSNLNVSVDTNNAGLFGFASVIRNVKIHNATVSGVVCVGALVGELESSVGTVDNCHVTGKIQITGENSVGGLAGKGYANIKNSSVVGDGAATSFVKGVYGSTEEGDNVGGIIGHLGEGNTLGVSNSTVKNITVIGTRKVGGIVGTTARGNDMIGCTVDGVVVESSATAEYANANASTTTIGGIVGNYFGSATSGGVLQDCTVQNVKFNVGNAKSAGSLVGGDRNNNGGAPVGVDTVSGNVVDFSTVEGSTNDYLATVPVYVAEIDGVKYESLKAAVDAATNGDTVTVIADVTDEAVTVDKSITITGDATLNNVSITISGTDVALTVTDLNFTGSSYINANNGKALTVKGVTAIVEPTKITGRAAFIVLGTSELTHGLKFVLKNSVIDSAQSDTDFYSAAVFGWRYLDDGSEISGNTFGTEENPYTFIAVKTMNAMDGATITVANNTVYGTTEHYSFTAFDVYQNCSRANEYTVRSSANTINVEAGENDYCAFCIHGNTAFADTTNVTLLDNGSTVNGKALTIDDIDATSAGTDYDKFFGVGVEFNANGEIIGGTFSSDVSDFCADGFKVEANGDGSYGVVVDPTYGKVAKIGDTYYATLADALAAAVDGDTVTLLADVSGVDVTIKKNVTLDLGGKTITDAYIKIEAEVTVQNGSIKNTNESYPLVVNNSKGVLTINNVAIEASKSDRAIWVRSGGSLFFNSGSILATKGENNTTTNLIAAIYTDTNTYVEINGGTITVDTPNNKAIGIFGNYTNANVTVNGGKISTSGKTYSYGINVDGDITVNGGEIVTNEKHYGYSSGVQYGKNYALVSALGDVTITGGTITTNGSSGYIVSVGRTYSSNDQTVTITGGTFTNVLTETDKSVGGNTAPVLLWEGSASNVTATVTNGSFTGFSADLLRGENTDLAISGGTFDVAINEKYCAEGFEIKDNGDGTYGVVVDPTYGKVAKIGDTYYATLADALAAAVDGDTVTLLADVSDVDVTIKKNVTLDLGGKTITDAYIKIEAEVTVQNGSIKNTNEPYPLVVQNGGKLTVNELDLTASKSDLAIWVRENSSLIFNSGSILATKGENNTYSTIYAIKTAKNTYVEINGGSIAVNTPDAKAIAIYGNYENADVVVNDGKISTIGKNYSYAICADGDITVNGGEIVTNAGQYNTTFNYAIVSMLGDVTVTDGTITTNGNSSYLISVGRSYSAVDQTVTITGGTFVNNGASTRPALINKGGSATVTATITKGTFNGFSAALLKGDSSTLTVSGGTFDVAIKEEYCAEGFEIKDNGDGTYGIVVDPAYGKVAMIDGTYFDTLADALAAAQDGDVITLIYNDGDAPISMAGAVYGKTVTITGTAVVDWDQNFLFVGRGGVGNGTVIFENAYLTSASNSGAYGIHVSGREKDTTNKYDGTLIIKNSEIVLDYLINKGTMTVDNSKLTVKNGFSIGGRPADETESGVDATATIDLINGAYLTVNNHNGMGLGYEAIGVMNVTGGSTFECTQDFLVTAKGTLNVDGGNLIVASTLTNNGTVTVKDTSLTDITISGAGTTYFDGTVNFYGTNSVVTTGANNGGQAILGSFDLIVNKGATLLISRFVLGYNRNITVYGEIEDAHTFDPTGKTPSLKFNSTSGVSVGGDGTGNLTVVDAYIELGNSSWKYAQGTYTWTFTNSYVSATSFTNCTARYSDDASWTVTFDDSVLTAKNYIKNGVGATYNFTNGSVATTGSLRIDGVLNIDATSSVTTTAQQNNVVGSVDEHGGINGTVNVEGTLTIGSTSKTQLEMLGGTLNVGENATVALGNNTLTLDATSELASSGNVSGAITAADGANVAITGGTYTQDVSDWCVDGYLAEDNGDGTFGIVVDPAYGKVAMIGGTYYATIADALRAAQNGDTITLIANASLDEQITLTDITLTIAGDYTITTNDNLYVAGTVTIVAPQLSGIVAAGDVTFVGLNKVGGFSAGFYNRTITIGVGASLEITGTGRMTVGWGNTFNIEGDITDAKNVDKSTITPSLKVPAGISITGSGATLNIINAYVVLGLSTSASSANGEFDLNFVNSVVDITKFALQENKAGYSAEFDILIKDSEFTTSSNFAFSNPNANVVIDNSNVTVNSAMRNSGTMLIQNGSVVIVKAMIQFGENAGNNGVLTIDGATLNVACSSTGHAFDGKDTGVIKLVNGAVASVDYLTNMAISIDITSRFTTTSLLGNSTVTVDVTGMECGDTAKVLVGPSDLEGKTTITPAGASVTVSYDGGITVSKALKGAGTATDPYQISSKEEFFYFAKQVNNGTYTNVYVVLTADIDLEQDDWTSIGTAAHPFTGTFDGQDHIIFNLWCAPDQNGLFGYTSSGNRYDNYGDSATIKNFTLDGAVVTDGSQKHNGAAAIVGCGNMYTTVSDVTVKGEIIITGARVGAIVGYAYSGAVIENCHVDADDDSCIRALYWAAGGIMGFGASDGKTVITNCSVKNVTIEAVNHYGAAGIIGNGTGVYTDVTVEDVTIVGSYEPDYNAILSGGDIALGNSWAKNTTLTVGGTLVTAPVDIVATVGDYYCATLAAAVNVAQNGATITVLVDLTVTGTMAFGEGNAAGNALLVVSGKNVTVDLNGKTVSAVANGTLYAFFATANNGHLTLKDSVGGGRVVLDTAFALLFNYDISSSITVESGSYKLTNATNALVQNNGTLKITGGTFTLGNADSVPVFAGNSKSTVTGGTYNANIASQANIPEAYALKNVGDGTYTIVDAVASANGVGYATLAEAIAAANGGVVKVLCDVSESLTAIENVTLKTDVVGGVTITNTYADYVDFNGVTLGSGVTLNATNIYSSGSDSVNIIEGTLNVSGTYYHSYDAKTTIQNGGKVTTGGMTVLRYNTDPNAGIYIYGDNNDETVEFACGNTMGTYSGTFYAENATIQTNMSWLDYKKDNTEEPDQYAPINYVLNNSTLNVTSELRLYKDAALTLTNSAVTAGKVQIRVDATPVVTADASSTVKAASVENLTGASILALLDENGNVSFAKVVATVNGMGYATLAEAIAAATAGQTVTVVSDVTISEMIKINTAITLDLGTYTVTSTANKAFEIHANTTIKNGTIVAAQRCVDTRVAVELTLTDVTLRTTGSGNTQPLTIGGYEDGTKVTLTGVTINAGTAGYGIIAFVETELNITDSNVSGYGAVYMKAGSENSVVNVVGSALTSYVNIETENFAAIVLETNNIQVTVDENSEINAVNGAAILFSEHAPNGATAGTSIQLDATVNAKRMMIHFASEATVTTTIATVADQLIAEGYIVEENAGVWSVKKAGVASVEINGEIKNFTDLQEAINAVKATGTAGTVKLVDNVTVPMTLVLQNVTLDLNGYTLDSENFVVFKGGYVVDNTTGLGLLKSNKDSTMISIEHDNVRAQMPYYDEVAEGYRFAIGRFGNSFLEKVGTEENSKLIYSFTFMTGGKIRELVTDYNNNDDDLEIIVRLTWSKTDAEGNVSHYVEDVHFSAAQIAAVVESNGSGIGFKLTISGYEGFEDLAMQAMAISGIGVLSKNQVKTVADATVVTE